MPEFDCRLVTEDGTVMERVIEAESKYEIYDSLETRNEMALSIKKHRKPLDVGAWLAQLQRVKPIEIEHFTSQLAVMLDAGVPLLGCLESLVELAESDRMKGVIKTLTEDLNSGLSFSQALSKHPRIFSLMYTNTVEAGERAGVLDMILKRLSQFIGHELEVMANIKSAMRYPIIIFCVLILAFSLAILFVIPRFADLFMSQGVELPLPTKILIGINNALTDYWMTTLIAVAIIITGAILFFRTPRGEKTFDYLKLKAPVFKTIFLNSVIARFAHMLETLSRSGIQILSALETVEKTVDNVIIGEDIAAAREKVSEGIDLATALSDSKYFPPMTLKMISVGEQSGALDEMLNKVATQYDSEVDHIIKRLTAMIEPLMTVVMGVFLIVIALGIFLPMWRVYEVF